MATDKPRITISLEPDHHDILKRLSSLQNAPMSSIITDLLREVMPMLGKAVEALESAKKLDADARANFRRSAEEAEEELRPLAEASKDQLDLFMASMQAVIDGKPAKPPAEGAASAACDSAGGSPVSPDPRPVITGVNYGKKTAPRVKSASLRGK